MFKLDSDMAIDLVKKIIDNKFETICKHDNSLIINLKKNMLLHIEYYENEMNMKFIGMEYPLELKVNSKDYNYLYVCLLDLMNKYNSGKFSEEYKIQVKLNKTLKKYINKL